MTDETIDKNYEEEIKQASDEHDAEEEERDFTDDLSEDEQPDTDDKTTNEQTKPEVKNQSKGYKGSLAFKHTIKEYLENRALADPLFAETLKKENKNIDDCIIYIINQVQKSGCNGFADSEIFGMAVHYYDEDNIEIGKETNATVVVNHHIELTQEELDKAKADAIKRAEEEQYKKITKRSKPKPQKESNDPKLQQIISGNLDEVKQIKVIQQSLF